MIGIAIFGGMLVFCLVWLSGGIRTIKQYERGLKFTFGKYTEPMLPGLNYIFPLIQTMVKVDVRQATINLQKQEVMTKDQVNISIDGVVFYHISNPTEAVLNVQNLNKQIEYKATSELKEVVGALSMSEALEGREIIAKRLKEELDKAIKGVKSWGIEIQSVQINNLELPTSLVRAMAAQAEAEREKKARLIKASAELESADKLKKASQLHNKISLELRKLQTWSEIGKEQNSLIIVVGDNTKEQLLGAGLSNVLGRKR